MKKVNIFFTAPILVYQVFIYPLNIFQRFEPQQGQGYVGGWRSSTLYSQSLHLYILKLPILVTSLDFHDPPTLPQFKHFVGFSSSTCPCLHTWQTQYRKSPMLSFPPSMLLVVMLHLDIIPHYKGL